MTRQRKAILEELARTSSHPTADEVFRAVRRRLPGVGLCTVYRNLEAMSRRGLVSCIERAGSARRYDGRTGHHWHARCLECGRVSDVDAGSGEAGVALRKAARSAAESAKKAGGFDITGFAVEFTGRCPSCRTKGRRAGRRGRKR
jgi:Fur family ferric uptake transcriptional regulator